MAHALLHLDGPAEAVEHLRRRDRRVPPDLLPRVDSPLATRLTGTVVLPFADHALARYLPAVDATIDGRPVLAHLDTGGTFLVMGGGRARALGIEQFVATAPTRRVPWRDFGRASAGRSHEQIPPCRFGRSGLSFGRWLTN